MRGRSQAGDELTAQRPTTLHVKRLVDGRVGDTHGLIIGEIDAKPFGDLRGAPRGGPSSVLAPAVTATDPAHLRAGYGAPVGRDDGPGETLLHVRPQCVVAGGLATFARHLRRSACHCAVVAQYSNAPLRVAALRRSSREIEDGERFSSRAIARTPLPAA